MVEICFYLSILLVQDPLTASLNQDVVAPEVMALQDMHQYHHPHYHHHHHHVHQQQARHRSEEDLSRGGRNATLAGTFGSANFEDVDENVAIGESGRTRRQMDMDAGDEDDDDDDGKRLANTMTRKGADQLMRRYQEQVDGKALVRLNALAIRVLPCRRRKAILRLVQVN